MPFAGCVRGAFAATTCLIATAAPGFAQQQAPVQGPHTTIHIYPPGTVPPAGAPQGQAPGNTAAPQAAPPQVAAPATPPGGGVKEASGRITGPQNSGSAQVTARVISLTREANTLMLRLSLTNTSNTDAADVWTHMAFADSYIVDPSRQRRAEVLQGQTGEKLATDQNASGVPAGETREVFAQFPEPPANVTSVNLYLKGFPPIMGVPITAATQSSAPAEGPKEATGRITGSMNSGSAQVTARVISLTREANTLMLRLSLTNTSDTNAADVWTHMAFADSYIVDPSSQRRAGVIQGQMGERLATDQNSSGVPAGETREVFAQFPQLPGNVNSVTLYLKGFPPIMGVPVN